MNLIHFASKASSNIFQLTYKKQTSNSWHSILLQQIKYINVTNLYSRI